MKTSIFAFFLADFFSWCIILLESWSITHIDLFQKLLEVGQFAKRLRSAKIDINKVGKR